MFRAKTLKCFAKHFSVFNLLGLFICIGEKLSQGYIQKSFLVIGDYKKIQNCTKSFCVRPQYCPPPPPPNHVFQVGVAFLCAPTQCVTLDRPRIPRECSTCNITTTQSRCLSMVPKTPSRGAFLLMSSVDNSLVRTITIGKIITCLQFSLVGHVGHCIVTWMHQCSSWFTSGVNTTVL